MNDTLQATWLPDGYTAFGRMLAEIAQARVSIRLETYLFSHGQPGDLFRDALAAAAGCGVRVAVLVDGFGSRQLPGGYWRALTAAGGEVRVFNPLTLGRGTIRDHRKLLVVDDRAAFVGGFNIAAEYAGDGVERGWYDVGLELRGGVAEALAATFDVLYAQHDFRHPRLSRWRRARQHLAPADGGAARVLATGPGLGRNVFLQRLRRDLATARDVQIVAGYFIPGYRLRGALVRAARRGARVRLLLAGRSDVPLAQAAGRAGYGRLLRAGVEIGEYRPQVLHAKLAIVDDAVYAGSANLDRRSFDINYEVMVRIEDARLAAAGRALVAAAWTRADPLSAAVWRRRPWWARLRERWARFVLTRIDPWFARRQLRRLV